MQKNAVRIGVIKKPAIILLDIQMPGDGLVAARVISQSNPVTRIAMFTNADDDGCVWYALMAGGERAASGKT